MHEELRSLALSEPDVDAAINAVSGDVLRLIIMYQFWCDHECVVL